MADSDSAEDYASHNARSLRRLERAIGLSKGQFSLNFVRCNYAGLRAEMQQRLQTSCSFQIRAIVLPQSAATLYTAIKTELGEEQPLALMVSGLESVAALDNLLVATNQVRDDFRKSFAFPMVLWVNDEVLKKLIRLAPDFSSWANVPIQFTLASEDLIVLLEKETGALFAAAMEIGAGRFPRSSALYPEVGTHSRGQLKIALKELRDRGQEPSPALAASLQFALGQDAYTNEQIESARGLYEQSLAFWQQPTGPLPAALRVEREGCLLFYLGLWWRRWAVLHRADQLSSWRRSRDYYQQSIQVFQQGDRPDLAAKFINALGEVLRRLVKPDNAWNELESIAKTAIGLHRTYFDPIRLAYGYGLLAEVALSKSAWAEAKHYAELALQINHQPPEPTPTAQRQSAELNWARQHYRSLYLLFLAQSQQHLDSLQQAIETLETAKAACNHAYDPLLYTRILEVLRELYFQQGEYIQAFETKREQRSIEQQYSLRAFIGAVRLQPERQVINPGLVPVELAESTDSTADSNPVDSHPDRPAMPPQSVEVAQEIIASGRYHDVEKLIRRLSESRYNLTIIHGQSGVGKSSIINAGLVPALKQHPIGDRRVLPVVLRVYKDWIRDFGKSLVEALEEANIREKVSGLESTNGNDIQPLIEQLRDNADRRSLLTILIFDQFEEFFFANPKPRDRRSFFEFLHTCLSSLPFVKVVLSLREDYLHYLLEGSRLYADDITRDILGWDKRFSLGNFSISDARLVIQRLTQRSQFHLDTNLIEQLVKDLSEELQAVRPIELQIVGAQLQESDITTLQAYEALEPLPKEKLVEQFLEQVIRDCGPENKQTAELILYLLTDDKGTRPLKTKPEMIATLNAWELPTSSDQIELVLNILVISGLVLDVPEIADVRYQLVHDYLATLVRRKLRQEVEDYRLKQQLQKAEELSRKRNQRNAIFAAVAVTLGLSACGLALFAFDQGYKATIAELEATNALSAGQLSTNNQLEALRNSVKAGSQFKNQQNPVFAFLLNRDPIATKTVGNLITTVYSTQEHDRLIGHRSWVSSVSFNPRVQLLASASADNTIMLWDRSGRLVNRLEGHTKTVNSVSFTQDGQRLASASDDGTVKLWSVAGKLLADLTGHQYAVTSVSFSPDGQLLASASDDGTVKLWNTQSHQIFKTLEGHKDRVKAVSFSPDGKTIASASWDGTVRLWNREGKEINQLSNDLAQLCTASQNNGNLSAPLNRSKVSLKQLCEQSSSKLTSLSFSPNGTLAVGSWDNTIKLWSPAGKLLQTLTGHTASITSVGFSPTGKIIVSASTDGTVKLWDSQSGIELRTLKIPRLISASLIDDNTLASTDADASIKLWNLEGIPLENLQYASPVTTVSFSPDGQTLASASKGFQRKQLTQTGLFVPVETVNGQIKVWRVGGSLKVFPVFGSFVRIQFSPDGQTLASAENTIEPDGRVNSQVRLWNLDGKELKTLTVADEIADISFSADGKEVAIAENFQAVNATQGKVMLWNLENNARKTLAVHNDKINSLSLSPDGTIATASNDFTVRLWTATGEPLQTLRSHTNFVKSVSFSPDGKTIATASADNTIKLWNLKGKESKTLVGHTSAVTSISFSQDGKLLVSSGDDGTIKIWNLTDGTSLATLQRNDNQVNSVSFSPRDSKLIASAGNDNQVSLWQFDLDPLLKRGCDWLKSYLKPNQNEGDRKLCPNPTSQEF